MEMHTTSSPAPHGPGASTLGLMASPLRVRGAVATSVASDGGRPVADVGPGVR